VITGGSHDAPPTGCTRAEVIAALKTVLDERRVACAVPLAPLTTFHVGGPADYLVEAHSEDEVLRLLRVVRGFALPLTVLGGGSNVLVSDRGLRGVVLLVRDRTVNREGAEVRAGAGLTINGLVRWTVGRGLAGIEAWAGTPGTVGGAVHGNAHFQGRLIGDVIRSVRLATRAGEVTDVPAAGMEFGYDVSRVQRTGEVVLSVLFDVRAGAQPEALRRTARESLAFRKRTQPLDVPSAGCIFQNPDPSREPIPDGVPASAGALVDRAGLKGTRHGGAVVSTTHGNFIVHGGNATAADIRTLVERCKAAVADRFGVRLREEIVYLGQFD
jgi:UDP-N-acetylmuramate dehydrogenase